MVTTAPALPDGPVASGAPYWIWFGGRPAVDFANTVRRRRKGGVELLVTPDDLAAWLVAAGLVAEAPAVDRCLLVEAIDLRAAITEAIESAVGGRAASRTVVSTLNHWLDQLPSNVPRLEAAGEGLRLVEETPPDAGRAALAQVALDAARALSGTERSRLRVCASKDCSVLFFDRSPAGARRWCSMKACGNRVKVAAHRERHRGGS